MIDVIESSKLLVRTLKKFLRVASLKPTDISQSTLRLQPGVSFLVALSTSVAELVEAIGVCFIVGSTRYERITLLMAWNAMGCVQRAVVPSVLTFYPLSLVMQRDTVPVFSKEGFALVVHSDISVLVS